MNIRRHLSIIAATLWAAGAQAQHDPQEALAQLETADGLSVSLFASEPQLVNPTCIDVDARGRVWVCEATNYRLFNQEIDREEGDRIRILEDTDGDGVCDKATTFYQDPTLQSPMGIAVLGDRVYVCQSPDLFYLEDTDGDGVADKRTVVLTGFKGVDNDHAIHGVTWGPDGHLYFSNGDKGLDVTDKSGNRIHVSRDGDSPYLAAAVLRSDFEGEHLELLGHNMRNPYEPTVDVFGNVFISDNDDDGNEQCRINYVMHGGDYGYTPRRLGNKHFDAIHWNTDRAGTVPTMIKTGFGSPCGMMYYENGALSQYSGTLLHADAGPRVIRSYRYGPKGAGFGAELEVILSAPEDSWFRPVDVCAAPDGSLFVADWYDPGVGGHRMGDVTRGRIYRITGGDSKYTNPALNLDTVEGALAAYRSPNVARRYLGFEALKARVADGDVDSISGLLESDDAAARAKGLWILAGAGKAEDAARQAAKDSDSNIRIMALKIDTATGVKTLIDDADPGVCREVLLSLSGSGDVDAVAQLARKLDPADRFYREAIGIAAKGIEEAVFAKILVADPTWNKVNAQLAIQLHPISVVTPAATALVDDGVDEELKLDALRAMDATGNAGAGTLIAAVIGGEASPRVQGEAMALLSRDEGQPWKEVLDDPANHKRIHAALSTEATRNVAISFIRDTRRGEFMPDLLAMAENRTASTEERKQAFAAAQRVARAVDKATAAVAVTRLAALIGPDESLATDALRTLAALPVNEARLALSEIMSNDEAYDQRFRRDAMNLLGYNEAGQVQILNVAEAGDLPQDLVLDAAELLHRTRSNDVRRRARQVLPKPADSRGEPLPSIAKLVKMNGDPARGRIIFDDEQKAQCSRCHVVNGLGRNVGPDLSNIGEKLSREGIYESILNPSAAISHEYEVYLLETEWEGDYVGFIQRESDTHYEIIDGGGEVQRVAKTDVTNRRRSPLSLMPAGLAAAMTAEELTDLVAYLETLK